uniref:AT-rich interactive domain-containing protein 2 isoform X2 n=1 Tax=Myxine glutinosa TaxID=7769 RepID=UPI00358E3DAD
MAKVVRSGDPRQNRAFLQELRQFHQSRGTPFVKVPMLVGREVNVLALYSRVTSMGGYSKVTEKGLWEDITDGFNFPHGCSNAAYALKQFYRRYLETYEKVHHFGEEDDEFQGGSRPQTPVGGVSYSYNYQQHVVPEHMRQGNGLTTERAPPRDYEKVSLSLLSGLPNEVDFALNVCLLLSAEPRRLLRLDRDPRLLPLLLAHAGIFDEGPGSLQSVYETEWRTRNGRDFIKFWHQLIEDGEIQELITDYAASPLVSFPGSSRGSSYSVKSCLFRQARGLGLEDREAQRVEQISGILRNLSFQAGNARLLASHRGCLRFLLLSAHCVHSGLQQMGLDTLGNISPELQLDPIDFRSTQLICQMIMRCLTSDDRFHRLRGLEVLGGLCTVEENGEMVRECVEPEAYDELARLLVLQDPLLLQALLDTLYQLSELGEPPCTRIAHSPHSIDCLVHLATLDVQSFGPEALAGVRVVEQAAPSVIADHRAPEAHTAAVPNPHVPTPPSDADGETFACQWLGTTFEASVEGSMSRADVYSEYLSACSRHARSSILTATALGRCLRTVFLSMAYRRNDDPTTPGYGSFLIVGVRRKSSKLTSTPQLLQPPPGYPLGSKGAVVVRHPIPMSPRSDAGPGILSSSATSVQPQRLPAPGETLFPPTANSVCQPNMVVHISTATVAKVTSSRAVVTGEAVTWPTANFTTIAPKPTVPSPAASPCPAFVLVGQHGTSQAVPSNTGSVATTTVTAVQHPGLQQLVLATPGSRPAAPQPSPGVAALGHMLSLRRPTLSGTSSQPGVIQPGPPSVSTAESSNLVKQLLLPRRAPVIPSNKVLLTVGSVGPQARPSSPQLVYQVAQPGLSSIVVTQGAAVLGQGTSGPGLVLGQHGSSPQTGQVVMAQSGSPNIVMGQGGVAPTQSLLVGQAARGQGFVLGQTQGQPQHLFFGQQASPGIMVSQGCMTSTKPLLVSQQRPGHGLVLGQASSGHGQQMLVGQASQGLVVGQGLVVSGVTSGGGFVLGQQGTTQGLVACQAASATATLSQHLAVGQTCSDTSQGLMLGQAGTTQSLVLGHNTTPSSQHMVLGQAGPGQSLVLGQPGVGTTQGLVLGHTGAGAGQGLLLGQNTTSGSQHQTVGQVVTTQGVMMAGQVGAGSQVLASSVARAGPPCSGAQAGSAGSFVFGPMHPTGGQAGRPGTAGLPVSLVPRSLLGGGSSQGTGAVTIAVAGLPVSHDLPQSSQPATANGERIPNGMTTPTVIQLPMNNQSCETGRPLVLNGDCDINTRDGPHSVKVGVITVGRSGKHFGNGELVDTMEMSPRSISRPLSPQPPTPHKPTQGSELVNGPMSATQNGTVGYQTMGIGARPLKRPHDGTPPTPEPSYAAVVPNKVGALLVPMPAPPAPPPAVSSPALPSQHQATVSVSSSQFPSFYLGATSPAMSTQHQVSVAACPSPSISIASGATSPKLPVQCQVSVSVSLSQNITTTTLPIPHHSTTSTYQSSSTDSSLSVTSPILPIHRQISVSASQSPVVTTTALPTVHQTSVSVCSSPLSMAPGSTSTALPVQQQASSVSASLPPVAISPASSNQRKDSVSAPGDAVGSLSLLPSQQHAPVSASPCPSPANSPATHDPSHSLMCLWKGCRRRFALAGQVFRHAAWEHGRAGSYPGLCLWEGCEPLERKRLSFLTHLQDKHCSKQQLLAGLKQLEQRTTSPQNNNHTPANASTTTIQQNLSRTTQVLPFGPT